LRVAKNESIFIRLPPWVWTLRGDLR